MNHEQSLADNFRSFMQAKAPEYGCRFQSFSLDGQDRDVGADYVLTDADRFAIVEFKYSDRDLISERFKTRRLTLCQELEIREDMRALHDHCHFISWSKGAEKRVMTNIYRHEICTQSIFGSTCGLRSLFPLEAGRTSAGDFVKDFFAANGKRSLSLAEFERYLTWVLKNTSASNKSTVQLVTHNPSSHDLALVQLNSIEEAQDWVRAHVSPPPPRNRTRLGEGI